MTRTMNLWIKYYAILAHRNCNLVVGETENEMQPIGYVCANNRMNNEHIAIRIFLISVFMFCNSFYLFLIRS